ncbi:MAG: CoA-binding protein, partial [Actinomycetota bacterium]|nr:CoA-binding protein [Actinomycetota bacterium]
MAEADLRIPETIEHRYDYDQEYISDILRSVKTIAMVGASDDKTKFSYGVLRQLNEIGYEILPVTS